MKIVKVTYTAKAEYVEHNKANINKVMNDLRGINEPGIKYSSYLGNDGRSFMHLAHFEQESMERVLFDLDSFKTFQQQLSEHGLESPPKTEQLTLVASCFDIF